MKNRIATTVKIETDLYDQFKILGIRHKLTLQGLIEKTIIRYVNDEDFRNEINNFNIPISTVDLVVTSSVTPIT